MSFQLSTRVKRDLFHTVWLETYVELYNFTENAEKSLSLHLPERNLSNLNLIFHFYYTIQHGTNNSNFSKTEKNDGKL